MSIDVQELVADELRRRAGGVTWQPAVLDRALENHRRHLLRRRATAGVGAISLVVAVLAGVVSAAIPSGRDVGGRQSARTVAYVVNRARSALGAASAEILEIHARMSNGWSYTAWLAPAAGSIRIDTYPPAGGPVRYYSTSSRAFMVNYPAKTYSRQQIMLHALGQPPGLMLLSLFGVSATWGDLGGNIPSAAVIRQQLATGSFRLLGAKIVDGQRLLHLRGPVEPPQLRPVGQGNRDIDIWISATTFLPVSSVTSADPYAPRIDSAFTWLPATRVNRAVFVPEVPTGFKNVSGFLRGLTSHAPAPSPSASPY